MVSPVHHSKCFKEEMIPTFSKVYKIGAEGTLLIYSIMPTLYKYPNQIKTLQEMKTTDQNLL